MKGPRDFLFGVAFIYAANISKIPTDQTRLRPQKKTPNFLLVPLVDQQQDRLLSYKIPEPCFKVTLYVLKHVKLFAYITEFMAS